MPRGRQHLGRAAGDDLLGDGDLGELPPPGRHRGGQAGLFPRPGHRVAVRRGVRCVRAGPQRGPGHSPQHTHGRSAGRGLGEGELRQRVGCGPRLPHADHDLVPIRGRRVRPAVLDGRVTGPYGHGRAARESQHVQADGAQQETSHGAVTAGAEREQGGVLAALHEFPRGRGRHEIRAELQIAVTVQQFGRGPVQDLAAVPLLAAGLLRDRPHVQRLGGPRVEQYDGQPPQRRLARGPPGGRDAGGGAVEPDDDGAGHGAPPG